MNFTQTEGTQVQPAYASGFRCVGAKCEDTCCYGWRITIDQETHDKYEQCPDSNLRESLQNLITINTGSSANGDYASLTLSESGCAFLSERLCSIQTKLGESWLPKTCATYPRYFNRVGDVLEATLDLSCPEAARLALSDPLALEPVQTRTAPDIPIPPILAAPPAAHEVRPFLIGLLRNRTFPLWQRLSIVGWFCEDVDRGPSPAGLVAQYQEALGNRLFREALSNVQPQPVAQLGTVLELILSRIGSEFTSRRFLDCYQEFMQGIDWTTQSTMEDLGQRYSEACSRYYLPVIAADEHVLENYLINYVWKNLFPFGTKSTAQKLGLEHATNPAFTQYKLLIAHYAMIRTVSIGLAGFHKAAFDTTVLRKVIQSSTKTFEHSLTHPARVLEILAGKGMKNVASLATIIRDF